MQKNKKKAADLKRRHYRVRSKVKGTAERPRLLVIRSLKNISAQIIDDVKGVTLVSATTNSKEFSSFGGNIEAAKVVGQKIAEAAKEKSISQVVFDRGGRQYHGRIQALADSAREAGLKF